jgi:hypothetical protein
MSLTPQEVVKVVNRYIGVEGGYLGDFSYRTHAEFYPEYCDLDIDPNDHAGTTRERFIEILSTQPPRDQAKILRGVIDRFAEDDNPARARLRPKLEAWINRLESALAVGLDTPEQTRDVVLRALADADGLIRTNGATSAVDRIHTALHGHVLALCEAAGIEVDRENDYEPWAQAAPAESSCPGCQRPARRRHHQSARGDSDGARFPQPAPEQRERRAPERGAARRTRGALGDQFRTHGLRVPRRKARRTD